MGKLISRNVVLHNKRTSIRLEPQTWDALKEIAKREKCSVHKICEIIYVNGSKGSSFTSAVRVFIMMYFKAASTEIGHTRAGHGDYKNMINRIKVYSKNSDLYSDNVNYED